MNEMNEMNEMNDMNDMNEMHDCLIAWCCKDCFPRRTPRFPNSPIPPTPKAPIRYQLLKLKRSRIGWLSFWSSKDQSVMAKMGRAQWLAEARQGKNRNGPAIWWVVVLFFFFEWGKARIGGSFTQMEKDKPIFRPTSNPQVVLQMGWFTVPKFRECCF